MNARLRSVLEEAAFSVTGGVVDAGKTQNQVLDFQWDPDDATTKISFGRQVTFDANSIEIGRPKWAASNVPEIGAVVNGGGDAKANLAGSTTLGMPPYMALAPQTLRSGYLPLVTPSKRAHTPLFALYTRARSQTLREPTQLL